MGQEVKTVDCGANHMGIIMEDGQVFCWGRNEYGQMGIPEANKGSYVPLEVKTMLQMMHMCSMF